MDMRIRSKSSRSAMKKTVAGLVAGVIGLSVVMLLLRLLTQLGGLGRFPLVIGIPLFVLAMCAPLMLAAWVILRLFPNEPFDFDGRAPRIQFDEATGVITVPTDQGELLLPIAGAVGHLGSSTYSVALAGMPGDAVNTSSYTVRTEKIRIGGPVGAVIFTHEEGPTPATLPDIETWPPLPPDAKPIYSLVYRREFWPFVRALQNAGLPVRSG